MLFSKNILQLSAVLKNFVKSVKTEGFIQNFSSKAFIMGGSLVLTIDKIDIHLSRSPTETWHSCAIYRANARTWSMPSRKLTINGEDTSAIYTHVYDIVFVLSAVFIHNFSHNVVINIIETSKEDVFLFFLNSFFQTQTAFHLSNQFSWIIYSTFD